MTTPLLLRQIMLRTNSRVSTVIRTRLEPSSATTRRSLFLLLGSSGLSSSSMSSFRTAMRCDDGGKLPKDEHGNIQWTQVLTSLNDGAIWDGLATMTGGKVQGAIDSGIPTQLSYGFISGYCSGMALKKVGRAAATVFGLGFMCLQTLNYNGYIQVDHSTIRRDMEDFFDLNEDGKVDQEDGKMAYGKLMKVLTFNLPAGSGFAAGFVGGIRA